MLQRPDAPLRTRRTDWQIRPVNATAPLIDADELALRLADPLPPVVIDVRWRLGAPSSRNDYLTSHIPGAVWADLDADLAGRPGIGGRHPLPDPSQLRETLRRWGMDDDSAVVVYDASDATAAARAWWVIRWAGISAVRVLDGGLRAWTEGGRPLQTGLRENRRGSVTVRPGSMPVVNAEGAAEIAAAGTLLDARAPERFRGESEPIDAVAGHIPGALNAPGAGNTKPDGRFLAADELAKRFAEVIANRSGTQIGAYCGSGVVAAQTVLALERAGLRSALYVGSWSEWITDPSRLVALAATDGVPEETR